jgi:hypothetical protein
MTDLSDSSYVHAVVTPGAALRYHLLRWSAVDRGWKAIVIGLLIVLVVVQT